MVSQPLFQSFFMGGFECSSQRMLPERRVDMLTATRHDALSAEDYARLRAHGIGVARDGIRWHMIEQRPGVYDFSSVLPMLRAARAAGIQVVWDLCHYGWPDDLDVFAPDFVERCAGLARALARLLAAETPGVPFIAPMNEISFLSWVAGEVGHFYPFAVGRGYELKRQLVRAALAAIDAIWDVMPTARIVHTDPLIHVVADPARPQDHAAAEAYRQTQYQSWDMIGGYLEPELGGHPRYLDIIGLNYYPHNQWQWDGPNGPTISYTHPDYRPLRHLLAEVYARYGRPLFIAETSSLGTAQPVWLRYVGREVRAALRQGVPVEGICIYPIIDAPDWNDDDCLHQGLCSMPDHVGARTICRPLARELRRQQALLQRLPQAGAAPGTAPLIHRAPQRRKNAA